MKIAIISPPWISLPPHGYGGIEDVVFNLSEGLTKKKHEVYVYATGDSKISSQLKYYYKNNLGIDYILEKEHTLFLLSQVHYALQNLPRDIDIIHNHCEYAAMYLLDRINIQFVHTLHGAFYEHFDNDQKTTSHSTQAYINTLQSFKHHPFVSISDAQQKGMPELHYVQTVYNGANINNLSYSDTGGDYISWLGRYSPLKGLYQAIKVAGLTKKKMLVSASIHHSRLGQFNKDIKPHFDNEYILFLGEIKNVSKKSEFLGKSKLFLFPIQWEEPFGLVMTEAMATGTPVIAFARGSAPELIKDGETGFLVNFSDYMKRGDWIVKKTGIEGLCEAVERIYTLPENQYRTMRKACRAHIEKHFTVEHMVDEYEKVYQKILDKK